jgi:hypothetical protein
VKTVERLDWRGIVVSVSYESDWPGLETQFGDVSNAHLEIEALSPERAVLPVTDTGYRSHFLPRSAVERAGRLPMLRHGSTTPPTRHAGKRQQEEGRQISLF